MDYLHHEPRAALITFAHHLTLVKLSHAFGGLYIWEYLTTLDFEWRVFRGRLPYRWTIWIYSFARLAGLVSLILLFVTLDVTTSLNCQLWVLFSSIFLCLASIAATLLIVLRTVAIWDRNKVVVTLTVIVWGASIGFHLYDITRVDSAWSSTQLACGFHEGESNALGFIVTLTADMVLLLIIFSGLLVIRFRGGGAFGLTRVLWKQGIIWLVLGFIMEVPQLVFISLHMNDSLLNVFMLPSQIIIIVAATRMHRVLIYFASKPSTVEHEIPQVSNLAFSKTRRTDTPSSALERVEIAIHTTIERHSTISIEDDDSRTIISTSEQTPDIVGHSSKYPSGTNDTYSV